MTLASRGDGVVRVDGYDYRNGYQGHYFTGTSLRIEIPEGSGAPLLSWSVNGRSQTGTVLETLVRS